VVAQQTKPFTLKTVKLLQPLCEILIGIAFEVSTYGLVPGSSTQGERASGTCPNTSQCLQYVVTVEWRLYRFADYHEYVTMAAFALSSQSYEPEIDYNSVTTVRVTQTFHYQYVHNKPNISHLEGL